ncbi:hypothetical protein CW745_01735 [Psychromonas sp. psych-6C06]|uniref:sensor histidine kinase n=1 Tax=Psychromonas sp. psych-6C06 TaxID=2058089 RepID=UPI000C32676F|nr:histidine kinase [Psychromonas sp. psych-6C06]PKF63592.1 hypothetical protein CW745_01735 [Psychromonas sp. psych-6C06]
MENVVITKEDVQEIVQSVKITFFINCIIVVFIYTLNQKTDIITQFFASQSIGLTIVAIIQIAKVLYPPFKTDYKKLYYFLPVPVLPASLIGINFLHNQATLPELMLLIAIITLPVMVLFQYRDNKVNAKKALSDEQKKSSDSDKALQANKLLLLQAQINPHFLFNTLDNVKQYINTEPEKALHLLTDYTFFLRQTLPSTQTTSGCVNDELALINAYIAIQQTRFPCIRFIEKVDKNVKTFLLPPLIIQPLIENAIVHGLAPLGHQGLITLTIEKEIGNLLINVTDNGVGFTDSKVNTESMAIKNIEARLYLYHPHSSLKIMEPDQGASIQITIPLNET